MGIYYLRTQIIRTMTINFKEEAALYKFACLGYKGVQTYFSRCRFITVKRECGENPQRWANAVSGDNGHMKSLPFLWREGVAGG